MAALMNIVHGFFDVGVKDCDDELAINYLGRLHRGSGLGGVPIQLTCVFTGSDGMPSHKALEYWRTEFEKDHLVTSNGSEIFYTTIEEYMASPQVCDYVLDCAPGIEGYDGSNITVNKKFVFAGDYITPEGQRESFNRANAEPILKRFADQGKLVDISSQHMSNMRFNKELFAKFPGKFASNTVFTAFLIAFGRMDPKHPVASKFAEGLVNPDKGRGVNYHNVKKMAENLDLWGAYTTCDTQVGGGPGFGTRHQMIAGHHNYIARTAAENYFKEIYGDSSELPEESVRKLTEINMFLNEMHLTEIETYRDDFADEAGSNIFEANGNKVYYSNFNSLTVPKKLQPVWEFFQSNANLLIDSFNPVYDLFAAYVLIGLINEDSGSVEPKYVNRSRHSVEEFQKNILEDFE